jgi:hypothetical protein
MLQYYRQAAVFFNVVPAPRFVFQKCIEHICTVTVTIHCASFRKRKNLSTPPLCNFDAPSIRRYLIRIYLPRYDFIRWNINCRQVLTELAKNTDMYDGSEIMSFCCQFGLFDGDNEIDFQELVIVTVK